jgi:hypothetical protein
VAERGQHTGDVEALAAGAFGDVGDAVRGVRHQSADLVREVEGGVQRDRQDHSSTTPRQVTLVPVACGF